MLHRARRRYTVVHSNDNALPLVLPTRLARVYLPKLKHDKAGIIVHTIMSDESPSRDLLRRSFDVFDAALDWIATLAPTPSIGHMPVRLGSSSDEMSGDEMRSELAAFLLDSLSSLRAEKRSEESPRL